MLSKSRIEEILEHYENRAKESIEEMLSIRNTEPIALCETALTGLEDTAMLNFMIKENAYVSGSEGQFKVMHGHSFARQTGFFKTLREAIIAAIEETGEQL